MLMNKRTNSLASPTTFRSGIRCLPNFTFSLKITQFYSCDNNANIIKSASSPYMQWRTSAGPLCYRMYCIILCSPSPGTSTPERMTSMLLHLSSLAILYLMKNSRASFMSNINWVPGLILLVSKYSVDTSTFFRFCSSIKSVTSLAARYLRSR